MLFSQARNSCPHNHLVPFSTFQFKAHLQAALLAVLEIQRVPLDHLPAHNTLPQFSRGCLFPTRWRQAWNQCLKTLLFWILKSYRTTNATCNVHLEFHSRLPLLSTVKDKAPYLLLPYQHGSWHLWQQKLLLIPSSCLQLNPYAAYNTPPTVCREPSQSSLRLWLFKDLEFLAGGLLLIQAVHS